MAKDLCQEAFRALIRVQIAVDLPSPKDHEQNLAFGRPSIAAAFSSHSHSSRNTGIRLVSLWTMQPPKQCEMRSRTVSGLASVVGQQAKSKRHFEKK